MANVIRGTKRRCPHCGAPFYDLNRHPIVCPKCDQEVKPEALTKVPLRSGRGAARGGVPKAVEAVEDVRAFDEDEVLVTADEDAETEDEDIVGGEASDEDEDEMRE